MSRIDIFYLRSLLSAYFETLLVQKILSRIGIWESAIKLYKMDTLFMLEKLIVWLLAESKNVPSKFFKLGKIAMSVAKRIRIHHRKGSTI